jgi:hypothetical protein
LAESDRSCARRTKRKWQRDLPPYPFLTTPFTIFTIHVHTHPVCKLPLMIPNPTSAAQLNTKTTLKDAQNCPSVYSAWFKGTLKYAMTRLAGRNRMVNLVSRRVMRVRCSTSRDSLRVRREKFCAYVSGWVAGWVDVFC